MQPAGEKDDSGTAATGSPGVLGRWSNPPGLYSKGSSEATEGLKRQECEDLICIFGRSLWLWSGVFHPTHTHFQAGLQWVASHAKTQLLRLSGPHSSSTWSQNIPLPTGL